MKKTMINLRRPNLYKDTLMEAGRCEVGRDIYRECIWQMEKANPKKNMQSLRKLYKRRCPKG